MSLIELRKSTSSQNTQARIAFLQCSDTVIVMKEKGSLELVSCVFMVIVKVFFQSRIC